MIENNPKVSIFTCVYNRADKINRVFESVKRQTYKNIEHVIVDDGSTDGVDILIQDYIAHVDYPVVFKSKKNGGKHTATNIAWQLATGDFIVQLDSDDELIPSAIERLVNLWYEIPEKDRIKYWCAQARVRTQHTNEVFGDLYPDNINSLAPEEKRRIAMMTSGEKIGLMRADIIKQYQYPEPNGVTFVSEGVLWKPLNKKYLTWYTNDIVRIYYVDDGACLSAPPKNKQTITNKCWLAKWSMENSKEYKNIDGKREILRYIYYWHNSLELYKKENTYFSPTVPVWVKILLAFLYIPSKIMAIIQIKRWKL